MLDPGPAGRVIGKRKVLMRNCSGQQGGRKAHDGMFGRERLKHVLNAQVFLTSVPVLAVCPSQRQSDIKEAETEGKNK